MMFCCVQVKTSSSDKEGGDSGSSVSQEMHGHYERLWCIYLNALRTETLVRLGPRTLYQTKESQTFEWIQNSPTMLSV